MSRCITFRDELTIDDLLNNARSLWGELMRSDELTVDISGVNKVDVAAIQMLIATKKECEANGKNLVIRTSGKINEMMSFIGLKL